MLFKQAILNGIAKGDVTLAFRRWKKPAVRKGSQLRTSIGVLGITDVDVVTPDRITPAEARRAGFESRDELLKQLDSFRSYGRVYRIQLRRMGADPRIALRERDDVTDGDFAEVKRRLERLDRASRHGAWTLRVLKLIEKRPAVRAGDLAKSMRRERLHFKTDVRKLKQLGLTISLQPGYRLSPRGKEILRRLRQSSL